MRSRLWAVVLIAVFCFACSGAQLDLSTPRAKKNYDPSESCYNIGYQWGMQSARQMAGQGGDPDVVIPERCRNLPETRQGIQDGINRARGKTSR